MAHIKQGPCKGKYAHLGTMWLHHVSKVTFQPINALQSGSYTRTVRVETTLGQSFELILFGDSEEVLRVRKEG